MDWSDLDVIDRVELTPQAQMKPIYQRLHVQYVSVFTCLCVCLSSSLHFVVVYPFWIYLDYYLSVAVLFNFSKARSQSNKDSSRNPNPDAGRTRKELLWKKYINAYLPYHRHWCIISVLNEEKSSLFELWMDSAHSDFALNPNGFMRRFK